MQWLVCCSCEWSKRCELRKFETPTSPFQVITASQVKMAAFLIFISMMRAIYKGEFVRSPVQRTGPDIKSPHVIKAEGGYIFIWSTPRNCATIYHVIRG